jgi:mono/diheme cytochrome c family protein
MRAICAGVGVALLATALVAQVRETASGPDQARKMLDTYCVGCHNEKVRTAGIAFDALTLTAVHENADAWEKALRKLRGRQMPPPGSRQPDQSEIDAFASWMEAELDGVGRLKAAPTSVTRGQNDVGPAFSRPTAGHVPIQRLTRTEFGAAVNDLLGIEIDAEKLLPAEIEVQGFDNIAAALSISPAFLDQYVAATRFAARMAVGEATPKVASAHYAQPATHNLDQVGHLDGLPLGTRGGMTFRHNFHADGEYRFTIPDLGIDLYSFVVETPHTLVILIDGREVLRRSLGGTEDLRTVDRNGAPGRAEIMKRFANIPVQVKAGIRDVAMTFIERARVESDEFVASLPGEDFSRGDREPRIVGGVDVIGPFNSPGVSETTSRQRVFICKPEAGKERDCARRITSNLARRAFRRPVTDADIDALMPYFERGRDGRASSKDGATVSPKPTGEGGGFDSGIEQVVSAVLVSPDFLFRAIHTPEETGRLKAAPTYEKAAPTYELNDLELASRLSFFLWSQGPDEALLKMAAAGKLRTPEALQAEALRMLKDRRASSLVHNFALKWLDLNKLDEVVPDPNLFPTFTNQLRRDLATEVESFLTSVLLDDRNVGELLTANHTFLNERLARHYGITSVFGPQFRRVTLDDPRRWGLLGKGAVELRTSYGDRTSPVLRGAWILGKLMGTPPTPPPPDVDTDLSQVKGEPPKTLRARMERHRSKPSCNQCHGVIDPIGFAMENFDAIGRWRDKDAEASAPIDAKTILPNGRPVDGPVQLRDAIFSGRDLFVRSLAEKLMMYAVGRELAYYDMPQVRAVVRKAATQNYRLSAIVSGIVGSDAFRMQSQ